MDHLPAREGEAYEKMLYRGDSSSKRQASGNLREVVVYSLLPTPTVIDSKGPVAMQRNKMDKLRDVTWLLPKSTELLSLIGTPTASMSHRSKKGISKDPNPRELAAMISKGIPLGESTSLLFVDGNTSLDEEHQTPLFDEESASD
jgi:hypothetical protein